MIRRLFILLFLFFLPGLAHAAEVRELKTPAGFTIWFVREDRIPALSVEILWRGGSALEPAGKEGLAVAMAAMIDEGAGALDSLAFQTALEDKAIELRFSAGMDSLSASMRSLSEHRAEAFHLLGLALNAPRFDFDAFERIRNQLLIRVQRKLSTPDGIASRAFNERIFPGHPYGRDSDGTLDSLRSLTFDDLRNFHRARMGRDNLVIGVVGAVDETDLVALIDNALAPLPARAAPWDLPQAVWPPAQPPQIIARAQPQAVMQFGLPGLKRDDPDYYALQILNWILGGGSFSSRLVEEVRDSRGLAYSVSTGLAPMQAAGLIVGSTASRGEGTLTALDLIRQEIARMAREGVRDQELAAAKANLAGAFPLRLGSNAAIAGMLVAMQYHNLPRDFIDLYPRLIAAVQKSDVERLARRLLDPAKLQVTIVGQVDAR